MNLWNIAECNKDVVLKIKLLNKGNKKGEDIKASLSSTRKSTSVINSVAGFGTVDINKTVRVTDLILISCSL